MKTNKRILEHRSAQKRRILQRLAAEWCLVEYNRRQYLAKLNREYFNGWRGFPSAPPDDLTYLTPSL